MNDTRYGRPTWAEIDQAALQWNFRQVRGLVGRSTKILAVVKANAYGHGAVGCSRVFAQAGADMLGVATVEEGVELRQAGLRLPIILFGLFQPDEAEAIARWHLQPTIICRAQLQALARVANLRRPIPVQLKVDTGMGRIGVRPEEAVGLVRYLRQQPHLSLRGVYTHFAHADGQDQAGRQKQTQTLVQTAQQLRVLSPSGFLVHAANSAAVIEAPATYLDMVRPGLMLYGLYPAKRLRSCLVLRPALTWLTRIVQLKSVPAGTGLSYGHTFVTRRAARIATLPVGYADGYSRGLSNQAQVLVKGHYCPVVGRVCMDMCLIDVTRVAGIKTGDAVFLIGRQGRQAVTADHLAEILDTISYEVVSLIGSRVPRRFK